MPLTLCLKLFLLFVKKSLCKLMVREVDKMDLIYLILLIISLVFLCLGKRKAAKTLVLITLTSYMTLIIRDNSPVWAYIVGLVKSGFKAYSASIWVLHNFLVIVSMVLSYFFSDKRNKKSGILFISLAIILLLVEHYNEIISLFI